MNERPFALKLRKYKKFLLINMKKTTRNYFISSVYDFSSRKIINNALRGALISGWLSKCIKVNCVQSDVGLFIEKKSLQLVAIKFQ